MVRRSSIGRGYLDNVGHMDAWISFCDTARTHSWLTKPALFTEMWRAYASRPRFIPAQPVIFGGAACDAPLTDRGYIDNIGHKLEWRQFCGTVLANPGVTKAWLFGEMWKIYTSSARKTPIKPLVFGTGDRPQWPAS